MFKRDMEGDRQIISGEWVDPTLEYLKSNLWIFTEKVDGTNIRVGWDGTRFTYGGRTDKADIPAGVRARLDELFCPSVKSWCQQFYPDGDLTFYGEGYGAKIQRGGGNYRANQDFVLFDVQDKGVWQERYDIEVMAEALSLDVVPIVGCGTLEDAVHLVEYGLRSTWGDFEAEGIVARPDVELLDRRGKRVITKIKAVDFRKK
jgi:hypothetical protein